MLSENDFVILPTIPRINQGRASKNLPPLEHAGLSKGEIKCPTTGQKFYAHNFLNVLDMGLLYSMIDLGRGRPQESPAVDSIADPWNQQYGYCDFDYIKDSDAQNIMNGRLPVWYDPDDSPIFYGTGLFKREQMNTINAEITGDGLEITTVLRNLEHYDPITFHPVSGLSAHPIASQFNTSFYEWDSAISKFLNDGMLICGTVMPDVTDWGSPTHSSSTSDPEGTKPEASEVIPIGTNGYWERVTRETSQGGTVENNFTSYTPVSYDYTPTCIMNSELYLTKPDNTRTLVRKGRHYASYRMAVIAIKEVVNYDHGYSYDRLARRYSIILYDTLRGGAVSNPTGRSYAMFEPVSLSMKSLLNYVASTVRLSATSYGSGNNYDILLLTSLYYIIFAYPTDLRHVENKLDP